MAGERNIFSKVKGTVIFSFIFSFIDLNLPLAPLIHK
jgi:hypothetical protein